MAKLRPVNFNPFAAPKLTPVDYDPFAPAPKIPGMARVSGAADASEAVEPAPQQEYGEAFGDAFMARTVDMPLGGLVRRVGESQALRTALDPLALVSGGRVRGAGGQALDDLTETGEDLYARGERMNQQAAESLVQRPESLIDEPGRALRYFGQEAALSAAPTATGLALSRFSPAAGLGVVGATAAGAEYGQRRQEGQSVDQATMGAAFTGTMEAATEMLPFDVMLGRAKSIFGERLGEKIANNFAARVSASAGAEGLGEAVNEAANIAYAEGVDGKEISREDAMRRVGDAFLIGGIMGGTLGGAAYGVERVSKVTSGDPDMDVGVDEAQTALERARARVRTQVSNYLDAAAPEAPTVPDLSTTVPNVGTSRLEQRRAEIAAREQAAREAERTVRNPQTVEPADDLDALLRQRFEQSEVQQSEEPPAIDPAERARFYDRLADENDAARGDFAASRLYRQKAAEIRADAGIEPDDDPFAPTPEPEPTPTLRGLDEEIGWLERGGLMIRGKAGGSDEGVGAMDFGQDRSGPVVGRTSWQPKSDFWPTYRATDSNPLKEDEAKAALRKVDAGEKLTKREQRFVDFARGFVQQREAERLAEPAPPSDPAMDRAIERFQRGQISEEEMAAVREGRMAPDDAIPFSRRGPRQAAPDDMNPDAAGGQAPNADGLEAREGDEEAVRAMQEMERRRIEEMPADQFAAMAMQVMGRSPDVFRTQLVPGRTVRETAEASGLTVAGIRNEGGRKITEVRADQGRGGSATASIVEDGNNVYLNVSELTAGGGAGERVYNAAFSYARNTGKNFVEDPEGLSDRAIYRRPVQQAAMMMKAGSAENIAPGPYLTSPPRDAPDVRPIRYDSRRRLTPTLAEHLRTVYANTVRAIPETANVGYDFQRDAYFERGADGRPVRDLSDSDLDGMAAARRANPVREAMVRNGVDGSGGKSPAPVGGNSIKVAAIADSLLRASGVERSAILGQLGSLAAGGARSVPAGLRGILPSRRGVAQDATPTEPAASTPQSVQDGQAFTGDERATESSARPAVVAWAKGRFGDATAPNGRKVWQNFVEWFGDSQVVDANGEPLVVYHGTQEKFDAVKTPAFFAVTKDAAAWYASDRSLFPGEIDASMVDASNILNVYLSIKKPFDARESKGAKALIRLAQRAGVDVTLTEDESGWDFYTDEISKHSPYNGDNPLDLIYIPAVRAQLESEGFDGVHASDVLENDSIEVWIPLRPEQVKSADRTNPDIRKSARAQPARESFQGITPDQARNIARDAWGGRLVKRLTDSGILNFVTSEEARKIGVDAPLRATEGDRVAGFYVDGKAYIVADQIKPEEVAGVVLHEVGEHYGMERMLGTDLYNRLLTLVERRGKSGTDPEIRKAWESAKSAGTPDANMAQETLAYLLEQAPGNGIVTRAVDAIKSFLNRLGVPMSRLENEAELLRRVGRESMRMAGKEGTVLLDGQGNRIGPQYSRRGSDQTQTPEFKRWFGDSKVVDENGKPLVVYHGTRGNFTVFDYSKIGQQGRSEGAGFYFTNSQRVASGYGDPMQVYLSLQNPLSYDAKGFNKATVQRIVKRVAELEAAKYGEEIADGFLANFGDVKSDGLPAVVRAAADLIAADETAVDQLSGIVGSGASPEFVNQATRDVTGVDGFVADGFSNAGDSTNRIFVAFFPEQIKSATDNVGTFDPANPDIRYSRRTPQQARAEAAQNRATLRQQLPAPGQWNWSATAAQRREGWRGSLTRLREQVQDRMLVFRDARDDIQAQGAVLNDAADVYTRENLSHGRAGERITRLERDHVNPLISAMKQAGVKPELMEDYLEAAHARERNEAIAKINPNMPDGGSGISTADADAFLNGTAKGARSGETITPAQRAELATLADRVKAVTAMTRKTLLDAGIIDKAKFDAMEKAYQNYVPLRDRDGVEAGYERIGTTIRRVRDPIKRALGRGEGNRAENILAEVFGDAQRAIILSEKARVDQTLLRMALEHPNDQVWEVEPVKTEQAFSEASGEVYTAVQNIDREPGTVIVPWKGKKYRVLLKDPRMADAYNRLSAENLNAVFRFMGAMNRWFSAVLTRYNPGFVAVNLARDFQLGLTGVAAEHGMEAAAKVAVGYPSAMRAMYRQSAGKAARGKWGTYAEEFAADGGKTAFGLAESVEDIQQRIGAEFKTAWKMVRERRPGMAIRKWLAGSTIIQTIEQANDAVENAIRLSTYVALREKGLSREKAAQYAKDLTVNFNRRGQQTSILNAFYLFFNAAVQGSHRVIKLMKDNHGKMSAVLGTLAATQAISALFAMGMTDEDDEDAWSKIPDWEKQRNLIFVYPTVKDGKTSFGTIKVPMPYGFNVFPYAGGRIAQLSMDMANGKDVKAGKFTNDIASGLAGAFSPLPLDQQGWRAALPYFANIGLALQTNKDDLGRRITNEQPYSKYEMPRLAYGKDDTPEPFVVAARAMNRLGGGDDYTKPMAPALLDWSPDDLEFLVTKFTGGIGSTGVKAWKFGEGLLAGIPMTQGDAPLVSSFWSVVNDRQAAAGAYYDRRDELERELARIRDTVAQGGDASEVIKMTAGDDLKATKRKDGAVVLKGGEDSLLQTYRAAEKQMEEIRDRIQAIYNDPNIKPLERRRQVRALQDERAEVQRAFNRRWREAEREQRERGS